MTVWGIYISAKLKHGFYDELKSRGVVAVGWPELGDLKHLRGKPPNVIPSEVFKRGTKAYGPIPTVPNYYSNYDWWWGGYYVNASGTVNPSNTGHLPAAQRSFTNFLSGIIPGDLVIGYQDLWTVGIAEICPVSTYLYDPNFCYAHCWFRVKWVDANLVGINWKCAAQPFLGIRKEGKHAIESIQLWDQYKRVNNFDPCQSSGIRFRSIILIPLPGQERTFRVFINSQNQQEFDNALRVLAAQLPSLGINKIVFKGGGKLHIPDFFRVLCAQNGIIIEILKENEEFPESWYKYNEIKQYFIPQKRVFIDLEDMTRYSNLVEG